MCPRCAENCTFCSNASTCQECRNGLYLTHTHWCAEVPWPFLSAFRSQECPYGYYKFGDTDVGRSCKSCKTVCDSCNSCRHYNECTTCLGSETDVFEQLTESQNRGVDD